MTPEQIRAAIEASSELQALATAGDLAGVARALSDAQPDVSRSLAVADMFDVLYKSGDYPVMKQAQLSGDARAVLAFATLEDARHLGPGQVGLQLPATVAMLNALQEAPPLLSQAGRDALVAAATARPDPIDWRAVRAALEGA